jgi:hypothetical protein
VLQTNKDLPASEVALKHKQLLMVAMIFRSMNSVLETRPIYNKCNDTIRGHVFCSFLALVLMKELQSRLHDRGRHPEWEQIKRDLRALQEVEVKSEGSRWFLRTELHGMCRQVLQAAAMHNYFQVSCARTERTDDHREKPFSSFCCAITSSHG